MYHIYIYIYICVICHMYFFAERDSQPTSRSIMFAGTLPIAASARPAEASKHEGHNCSLLDVIGARGGRCHEDPPPTSTPKQTKSTTIVPPLETTQG